MNFQDMIVSHIQAAADVTIAAVPVHSQRRLGPGHHAARRLGPGGRFPRKTENRARTASIVRTDPAWIDARGIASRGRDCLANMGIYLFNRNALIDVLGKRPTIAISARRSFRLRSAPGTYRSTCSTAIGKTSERSSRSTRRILELTKPNAPFELSSAEAPIYSHARFLPPTRIDGATIRDSLVADGSIIEEGAVIENSVIGLRCRIGRNVTIRDSVLMGSDFYETADLISSHKADGDSPLGVGEGTHIERGDHRQELPHRPQRPDRQRVGA